MHLFDDGAEDAVIGVMGQDRQIILVRDRRHVAPAIGIALALQRHDMGADLGQKRALDVVDALAAQQLVAPP